MNRNRATAADVLGVPLLPPGSVIVASPPGTWRPRSSAHGCHAARARSRPNPHGLVPAVGRPEVVDKALWAVIMTAYIIGTSTRKVDENGSPNGASRVQK